MLEATLQRLIPFRFLSPKAREGFVARAVVQDYEPHAWIVRQGDAQDRRMFVVLEGLVEVVDEWRGVVVSHIEQGRYFGERAALFDTPRVLGVRASVGGARVAVYEQEVFLETLAKEPALAHSLGGILRERQGIFKAFDAFMAELYHGVTHDVVNFRELCALYRELEPALHPHVKDELIHDFEALSYAVRRLPEGVTESFMLYLSDTLHEHLEPAREGFRAVETAARRRSVFELMPSKLMVLLRDGDSDLIDLVTCMCAFATEAAKLRRRMQREGRLATLLSLKDEPAHRQDEALERLGFVQQERHELTRLWPEGATRRLYQLAMHHEDYHIQITKQLQGYNSQHAERWTQQLAQSVYELMGSWPDALECDVHIISSNTHSVQNCLSPYLREQRERILAWGRAHRPQLFEVEWVDESDLLYALARHWFKAHPEEQAVREARDREAGMLVLEQTALTGVSVELVDTSRLVASAIDQGIVGDGASLRQDRALIVNIDYAFGQQAQEIMAILLMLFGHRVRSVDVLGKAGALDGERGDLLAATAFVEQTQDVFEPIAQLDQLQIARLKARCPDRQVHVGPVLTVAGTLLQNRVLLNFYKRIWGCTGLEMEGTYYLREIIKASQLGVIPAQTKMRFLYYVSDLPLMVGASLAGALNPGEGIPPLYAITREILCDVLAVEG